MERGRGRSSLAMWREGRCLTHWTLNGSFLFLNQHKGEITPPLPSSIPREKAEEREKKMELLFNILQ